jgi:hypothetical protein
MIPIQILTWYIIVNILILFRFAHIFGNVLPRPCLYLICLNTIFLFIISLTPLSLLPASHYTYWTLHMKMDIYCYLGLRNKSRRCAIYIQCHTFSLLKLTFNVILPRSWYSLNYRKKEIRVLIKKGSTAPKGRVS